MTDQSTKNIIFPRPLKEGDIISICSPAGPVNPDNVIKAAEVLRAQGWKVRIEPHALGRNGNYSGTEAERLADLENAFRDPAVRAVLAGRGGYGVVHLMDKLSNDIDFKNDPKWVIGFSDISAMHALMSTNDIASIHASMTSHIALGPDDPDNAALFAILRGERPSFTFPGTRYDRLGQAEGRLVGGNLAVISGLLGTRYDIFEKDTILFIEDVAEPIYKIERMLYKLRYADILPNLRGLIVGQFTEYKPDKSYERMEDMIADMVAPYSYPVAYNAPIGHVGHNIPVIENARVTLKVTSTGMNHLIYWT